MQLALSFVEDLIHHCLADTEKLLRDLGQESQLVSHALGVMVYHPH